MNMKRILAPIIILLLVLGWGNIIGGNAEKYKSYTEHMKNAKTLESKEIYIDAIDQYKKALEYTKNKLPVQEAMLDDYLKLKKYNDFEKQGNAILESYNYPKNVAKKMTDYYIDRKQTVNALKLVNAYLEKNAEDEDFLALQGKLRGSCSEVYFGSDDIKMYGNGFYVFVDDNKQGLLKSDGSDKIAAIYDKIYPYGKEPEYAPVCKDNDWYYIDKNGYKKLALDFNVESLGVFGNNLAPYCSEGKYSYIDANAKKASKNTYDFASGFAGKRAAVKNNGKWAIIKSDFSQVTDYIYDDVVLDECGFATAQNVYIAKLDGKYHIFGLDGKAKDGEGFDEAKAFVSDEPTAVKKDGKWGFANKKGEVELMTDYSDVKPFSNGFAAVYDGKKWGYINKNNTVVIDFEFNEAGSFNNSGVAVVRKPGIKFIQLVK